MFTKNNTFLKEISEKRIYFFLLALIFLVGNIFHIWSFGLNEVMRESDSIAYLQMAHFLKTFSSQGFGSGWFGFVYSLPIALFDTLFQNDFVSGKIVNMLLLNISAILFYALTRKILSSIYIVLALGLFFFSPTLLHFHIHILSENIYIPIFLAIFLTTWNFIEQVQNHKNNNISSLILIACLLGLLYLTRAEGFIYMLSIGLLALGLLLKNKLSVSQFFGYGLIFLITFSVFISPYLIHLHSITGEWGLTNKGASNYRQAELRGTEKMDDAGFEQAVGELTPDKHHLIAGFAGGMKYDAPQIEGSFLQSISKNKTEVFGRILTNQKKVFTKNLPEIFLGKSPSLFWSTDSRFSGNTLFLLFCFSPLLILIFGLWKIWKKQRIFAVLCICFFLPAFLFFTLFFTLNRYFIIFLPLLFLIFSYTLQEMKNIHSLWKWLIVSQIVSIFLLSHIVYYNTEKQKDEYYALKKEAGEWMKKNISFESGETVGVPVRDWSSFSNSEKEIFFIENKSLDIMERFPIVTYYSGSKNRWITPYTDDVSDIVEYARYNDIEYLVVDTMDFLTYRPELAGLLEETPDGMEFVKEWNNEKEQKVRVYKIKNE